MRHVDRLPASIAALVIAAASVLGACSATAVAVPSPTPSPTPVPATPSPTPPAIPSPACGGFHLAVVNHGSAAVAVRVNGRPTTTVDPRASSDISEWGYPSAGALPWKVEVVDPATNTVIATRDVTEASGQGAATIEVDAGTGGTAVVGEVQASRGC